jgi:broad specificity phosphatase PhoE
VLTSPRRRARHTCELVGLGQEAKIEPDLAEWDYGDYEGKLSSDIHKERPDWNVLRDGCPGGEMPEQVSDRADRIVARLCTMTGNVALFSHGQFGLALAARWIGLPVAEAEHFTLVTASLNILGYNPAHLNVRVIALWNATPALRGTSV